MNLYITRLNGVGSMMQLLQSMTADIAHQLGFREMGVYYYNANAENPKDRSVRFDGMIAGISAGDIVVCQFHTWNGLRFERALVEHIKAYRGRIIIFIHSVEALMIKSSRFMLGETVELYNQAEALIVPSYEMKKFLLDSGIRTGMKFIVQEMWDCTTGMIFTREPEFRREIHCAGIDTGLVQNRDYGVAIKIHYTNRQDELLMGLSGGGFGLEWYRDEYEHQYMRYGNSFFISRYLAAGIPVIVPCGISCQKLIEDNHLGLISESLEEAAKTVKEMNESEYQEYVRHVRRFAPALRAGFYTKKCLTEAVWSLFREDVGQISVQAEEIYELNQIAFTYTIAKLSYGGNIALSWNLSGKPDGFLICDSSGRLLEEIRNSNQHYVLIKGCRSDERFAVKAYVSTHKGKMVVAESMLVSLGREIKTEPRVSVVIPAYNTQDSLVRTLDSVLAQTFTALEIVIVDDGSTDHTPDIADWYAEYYSNVMVIHQQNAGVQAARNEGIRQAGGEYIGFVDSDDMIRPDMMELLYTSAKKNQCDIAMTSGYEITHRGYGPVMQYAIKEDTAVPVEEFLQMYTTGGYAMPAVWNKLYRTTLVKERVFPLIRYEDEAWTPFILSYAENVCYLDACGYEYDRSNCGGSLVDRWAAKSKEEVFTDHKRSILFYLENGNPDKLERLKELAKSELASFARAMAYEEYDKLREEIEQM